MSIYLESVPARHLATLVDSLSQHGYACEAALRQVKLSRAALALPEARIPRPLFALALTTLMAETGRRDLGFEMGLQTDLSAYPLLGQLLRTSRNLSDGLQRLAPYMPLATPTFRMQCQKADGAILIHWSPLRALPYDMMKLALECILVATHSACRQLFPARVIPMYAQVSWAAPAHAKRYSELAGLSVQFLSESTKVEVSLRIPDEAGELHMPPVSSEVWRRAQEACSQELNEIEAMSGWADWVTHILESVEDHQPTQTELASLMGICARTLARHIEEEGTSFKALVLNLRHKKAKQLLATSDISISELARLLGYAESANFSRAFKIRHGISASQFRRNRSSASGWTDSALALSTVKVGCGKDVN